MQQASNKLDKILLSQMTPQTIQTLTGEVNERNKQLEEKLRQVTHGAGKKPMTLPTRSSAGSLFIDDDLITNLCSSDEEEEESAASSQDEYEDEEEEEEDDDASIDLGDESSEEFRGKKRKIADREVPVQTISKSPRTRQYNTVEEVRALQAKAEQELMHKETIAELNQLKRLIAADLKTLADQRQLLAIAEVEVTKSLNVLESKEKTPLFAVNYEKENARIAQQEKTLVANTEALEKRSLELNARELALADQAKRESALVDKAKHEQQKMLADLEAREKRLEVALADQAKREKVLADLEAREKRPEAAEADLAKREQQKVNQPKVVATSTVDMIMAEVIKNNTMQISQQEFMPLLSEPVKHNLAFLALKPGIKACAQTVGTHEYLYVREANNEQVLLKMIISKQLLSPK